MPLTRTLKHRVLTMMAGKPVIRQGPRFVLLTGKNLETYGEIERLTALGDNKEAERLLMEVGQAVFGPDFDPNVE